ncbi:MAG: hypothetical protein L3J31_08035, partial [Bacteroidales bacterium]|nr:hypothetical protein [Bacteroidales bacterium]
MNKFKKYGLVLFLLFLLQAGGLAQIAFDNPQFINKKSGLPTDIVVNILKDDLGFMWFATDKGLCRWDGISVKIFRHEPADSSSIPGTFIPRNAFVYDSLSGNILLATENGLSFFDPHQLTFKNFISHDKSTAFLSEIQAVFVDRQGVIWLGTVSGLIRFARDGLSHQTYRCPENFPGQELVDKKEINKIFDIKQDVSNDTVLWLATLDGLLKFNKSSGTFKRFYFDSKKFKNDLNAFTKIIACSNRKLYLGTWNADMLIFNTVNEKFEFSFGPYATVPRYFLASPLVPSLEKPKDELWVSSSEGLGIFNTGSNKLKILKTFKNAEGNNYAPEVAFSDKEAIWLSSEYGAIQLKLSSKYFDNYFIPPVDENHWFLPSSFYEDTVSKRLYIGYARGQGLHYFDLQTATFHFIPLPKRILKENIVRAICPLNEESLLVLCPDEIYQLSLIGQKPVPLKVKYSDYPKFTDIVPGGKGKYWVSGSNSGLQQLDIATGNLREVSKVNAFFEDRGLLPKIKGIAIDSQNRIWFRNEESYGFYNPENDSMHYFSGKQAMVILSFFRELRDTVWVGTHKNGLGFINPGQPEKGVQIYNSVNHKSIVSLQRDASGNFFLLTSSGIEKLESGKSQTVVFNENEGLVKFDKWANRDPTLTGKLFKLSGGRFVIG